MSGDPFGNQNQQPRRRGMGFGGLRWWVLILFAGYAGYYYFPIAPSTRIPVRRC